MTEISPNKTIKDEPASGFPTGECLFTAPWGLLSLKISSDAMEVAVVKVDGDASVCKTLTPETLLVFLRENGLTHGVLPESCKELVGCLIEKSKWTGSLVIAEGRPPEAPYGAEYTMFNGARDIPIADDYVAAVDGSLFFSVIKNYISQNTHPADIPKILAKLVRGGDILVSKKQPIKGSPGHDVFGRIIPPPEFGEIVVGENVELIADDSKFSASCFGYPLILDRRISVFSPVVVSDDRMTAWYVQFAQLPPKINPGIDDLTVLLKKAGLTRGTQGDLVEDLCLQLQQEKNPGWYVVAKGMEPVQGKDGALIFEGTDPLPALREDGSIDFRVLNLVKTVAADVHFATLSMPTEGTLGYTLFGEELPTEPGNPIKVTAKANVRVEECEDGEFRYYSETEGVIQYQNGQLHIDPLYQVSGNVDFSTGNIDIDCCLAVTGNVCSGFTVKSTKDIVVNGILEPGAKVIAKGDLEVKGGIIGESTEVLVFGNLQAQYVQDAKIMVKGQVLINQYAFSAVIRSVGSIQVGPGTGARGGSIVGGMTCSSSTIEVKSTGSPSNVLTTIVLEPAPDKLAELKQLKKQFMECETSMEKIMRTLDLLAIEPDLVKQLLQEANPQQRELYIELLKQLNLLVKQHHMVLEDKKKLRDELWTDVDKMSLLVTKTFYSNTKVRIARKEFLNRADKGRTTITHDRQDLVVDSP